MDLDYSYLGKPKAEKMGKKRNAKKRVNSSDSVALLAKKEDDKMVDSQKALP